MAEAFKLAQQEQSQRSANLKSMRDDLISRILANVPNSKLTGHPKDRLPNHASFVFKDLDANTLLMLLDSHGFACSSGSACKTGDPQPSEILTHLGFSPDWALGGLRITLGEGTNSEDVNSFVDQLPELIHQVRKLS
jgi:cysteine desulfurase